jgi:hypothetical protein
MSPSVQIVDDIRDKEWDRREVVHTAFEVPVCGSED